MAGFFIYLGVVLGEIKTLIAALVDPLRLEFVGTNEAVIDTFPRILGLQIHETDDVAVFATQFGILRPFSLNVTLPGLSIVAVMVISLLNCEEVMFPAMLNEVEVVAAETNVIVTKP